jgi:multiple sugar transport system substrate-binding protein
MSLLEKDAIVKMYNKKTKKSIHLGESVDVFILLAVLILLISPLIINLGLKLNTGIKQKDLFLSLRCEELFGREITEKLLQDFSELNPDVRIRVLNAPDEKGREPDILILDENDGQAAPLVSFMDLLFYNIDILKTAGFDRPPKTREEFLAFAKTAAGRDNPALAGVSGAAMGLSPQDRQAVSRDIFSWIWASGGDFWPAGNSPVINTRTLVNDITFLGRLYREGALAPGTFETAGDRRLEEFAQGKIAMMIASSRAIPFLREKMGDGAFGVTTVPVSASPGKYSIGLSGFYAGVNAACAYPDEARNFVSFLAEQSPLFCAKLKAVPGNVSSLIPGDYVRDDSFYSKAWDIFEASKIVQGFSVKNRGMEYENAVLEEIRIFFEGSRTAQETAAAIQKRWDAE